MLAATVDGLLEQAERGCAPSGADGRLPGPDGYLRAIVAPHAGYRYSGSTAADAFARLRGDGGWARTVVVGPAHFVPLDGIALPSVDAFDTPLGRLPLDLEAIEGLRHLPGVVVDDAAHAREHSIEVELPFLQRQLGSVPLVPVAVGRAATHQVASVLDAVWTDHTLLVVSTDLSHYLPYEVGRHRDERTATAIVGCRPDDIGDRDACGAAGLRGLLRVATNRGLLLERVALRSSGDTAGPRAEVVGYGAFAVYAALRPTARPRAATDSLGTS